MPVCTSYIRDTLCSLQLIEAALVSSYFILGSAAVYGHCLLTQDKGTHLHTTYTPLSHINNSCATHTWQQLSDCLLFKREQNYKMA